MSAWINISLIAAAVMTFVGYLAAIGIALRMWRSFERPSKFLLGGLLVLLFSWLAGIFLPAFFARIAAASAVGGFVVMINAGQSVVRLLALGLMVTAVYIDRKPRVPPPREDFLPGDAETANQDVNPFATPR